MQVLQLLPCFSCWAPPGPPSHPHGFFSPPLHYLRLSNSLPQTAKSLVSPRKGSGTSTDHKAAWEPARAYSALQPLASFVCLRFSLLSPGSVLFIPAIGSASSAARSGGHLHETLSARHSAQCCQDLPPTHPTPALQAPILPGHPAGPALAGSSLAREATSLGTQLAHRARTLRPPQNAMPTLLGWGAGAPGLVPRLPFPGSPRPTGRCSPVSSNDPAAAGHTHTKITGACEILNLSCRHKATREGAPQI